MSETNAIDARHVELTYADGTEAVADLSLEIRAGEFFGFLGANGAGKTTTIKVLATLLKPTGGSVAVNGYDVESEPRAVRESIGYMAQETSIDPGERIDDLLELVDLAGVANKVAKDFSGGMKKRLDAATALVHDPPIVFLDEPTTGLDPKARNRLWDYFERINDRGTTVFLTTQYLEEADQLCDRIGVIRDGTIVADGSPAELKDRVGGAVLEIELADSDAQTRERAREVALEADAFDDAPIETADDGLSVRSTAARRRGPELLVALKEAGIPITGFNVRDPTLDDVFLAITGEGLDEDEAATEPGGPGASAAATEVDR
ncbi:ATP-binding cassette domain-containing protein [Haloterrigena sp. SYSU A558-1]|uniref:ATP-binding cassette domain-containing protein n=1 Tax=Haloterrigena gelatinilytica TaxID=2741724 RepID=A0ABX2LHL3_9EURY|nr:ATP-binding cassette domain-containing protein [Haloterrigena gelatinilytica]NUC74055.1 ATP-binding cassette domain-containing protein [Haloterrigena gelatinilytica]